MQKGIGELHDGSEVTGGLNKLVSKSVNYKRNNGSTNGMGKLAEGKVN